MKALPLFAIAAGSLIGIATFAIPSPGSIKLPNNLYGEWKESCMKALSTLGEESSAPFAQSKMVLGWNRTIEVNTTYFSDEKCTKRVSKKREWSTYQVLEAKPRSAKLAIRKDLGGGMIHQSVVEVKLSNLKSMTLKTLGTNIDLEELLPENPIKSLDKNAGTGERTRTLTREVL